MMRRRDSHGATSFLQHGAGEVVVARRIVRGAHGHGLVVVAVAGMVRWVVAGARLAHALAPDRGSAAAAWVRARRRPVHGGQLADASHATRWTITSCTDIYIARHSCCCRCCCRTHHHSLSLLLPTSPFPTQRHNADGIASPNTSDHNYSLLLPAAYSLTIPPSLLHLFPTNTSLARTDAHTYTHTPTLTLPILITLLEEHKQYSLMPVLPICYTMLVWSTSTSTKTNIVIASIFFSSLQFSWIVDPTPAPVRPYSYSSSSKAVINEGGCSTSMRAHSRPIDLTSLHARTRSHTLTYNTYSSRRRPPPHQHLCQWDFGTIGTIGNTERCTTHDARRTIPAEPTTILYYYSTFVYPHMCTIKYSCIINVLKFCHLK